MKRGVLGVNTGILPALEVNNRSPNILLLTRTRLSLPIKIPNRRRQRLQHIRPLLCKRIVHSMRRRNIRLATLKCLGNAQQAHDIRVIGMEVLTRIGTVDPNLVNLRRVLAQVLHVAKHVATAVLRDEVAQVGAETHVGDGGLVVAPFLDGEAFEEDEAFAVEEVLAEGFEVFGEVGEGKVFLCLLVLFSCI